MRKTLFLDFDGVLHPYSKPDFRHAHHITTLMEQFPKLHVVVHSSWRFAEKPAGQPYTVPELCAMAGCARSPERFDITSREVLSRWEGIEAYLRMHFATFESAGYAIVDDEPDNFPSFVQGCQLFLAPLPAEGLTPAHVKKLTLWLQGEEP